MNVRKLAESSGVLLFEDEQGRLQFAEIGGGGAATALFVLGLLAVISLLNAFVQGWFAVSGKVSPLVPLLLFAFGIAFAFVWRWVYRANKRQRERPVQELPVLLVLDVARGLVCEANGRELAPLAALRFRLAFQATSSSRRLLAEWPGGQRTLVRGNPFAGGLTDVVAELERRGLRP